MLRGLAPLVGLVFAWALFALLAGGSFVQWDNQRLMLLQTTVVGTAAIGATLIIISGGIDLSVGSSIALATVVIALLLRSGASPGIAALGGVCLGLVVGLAIGLMVVGRIGRVAALAAAGLAWTWMREPLGSGPALGAGAAVALAVWLLSEWLLKRVELSPFIVTLGLWGALRGVAKGLGDNQPVYPTEAQKAWLPDLMNVRSSAAAQDVAQGLSPWSDGLHATLAILPPSVWILLGLALLMAGVLGYTRFGRHIFAVGSNAETARLCGVRVERTKVWIYVIGVGCAGVAGLLQFAYLSMGDPTTAEGYELKVIAAVVIGGASLSGGAGSIRGTLIGALIMTVVDNGCNKLGLDNWVQEIVTGAIIVVAVLLDRLRQRAEA